MNKAPAHPTPRAEEIVPAPNISVLTTTWVKLLFFTMYAHACICLILPFLLMDGVVMTKEKTYID
jgi:hypothetical protein